MAILSEQKVCGQSKPNVPTDLNWPCPPQVSWSQSKCLGIKLDFVSTSFSVAAFSCSLDRSYTTSAFIWLTSSNKLNFSTLLWVSLFTSCTQLAVRQAYSSTLLFSKTASVSSTKYFKARQRSSTSWTLNRPPLTKKTAKILCMHLVSLQKIRHCRLCQFTILCRTLPCLPTMVKDKSYCCIKKSNLLLVTTAVLKNLSDEQLTLTSSLLALYSLLNKFEIN